MSYMQAAKARKTQPKQKTDSRPRVTVQLRPDVAKMLEKARIDGRPPTWLVNKALREMLTGMGYAK